MGADQRLQIRPAGFQPADMIQDALRVVCARAQTECDDRIRAVGEHLAHLACPGFPVEGADLRPGRGEIRFETGQMVIKR